MEHQWDDTDGKTEGLSEKPVKCHYVHHKSHWNALGSNLGLIMRSQ
jgi:hypothetical protein